MPRKTEKIFFLSVYFLLMIVLLMRVVVQDFDAFWIAAM